MPMSRRIRRPMFEGIPHPLTEESPLLVVACDRSKGRPLFSPSWIGLVGRSIFIAVENFSINIEPRLPCFAESLSNNSQRVGGLLHKKG